MSDLASAVTKYRSNVAVVFADGEIKGFSGVSSISEHDAFLEAQYKMLSTHREYKIVDFAELSVEERSQVRKDWLQSEPA